MSGSDANVDDVHVEQPSGRLPPAEATPPSLSPELTPVVLSSASASASECSGSGSGSGSDAAWEARVANAFAGDAGAAELSLVQRVDDPAVDAEQLAARVATGRGMLSKLMTLAWPVILAYLLEMVVPVVSIMVLGHLNNTKILAAAALATMFANVTGVSTAFGLATALDTLCSQAVGAGHYGLVGVQAQRGAVILLAFATVVVLTVWLNASRILVAAGQDPEIAEIAGNYILYMIPMLYALVVFEVEKKVCYALHVVQPQAYILGATSMLGVAAQVLAIHVLDLPYTMVPIINSATYTLSVVLVALYMRASPLFDPVWSGWDLAAALRDWGPFLRLGLPGVAMLCTEWWSFEILALMAGLLGTEELAAQTIILNIATVFFMVPLGQSIAVTTLVGNFLGAHDPTNARRASLIAVALVTATALFDGFVLIVLRNYLARAYTKDAVVIRHVSRSLVVVGIFQVFDGVQAVCSGVIRGSGRQILGAAANVIGYVVLGIPISALLAFHFALELEGLWIGMTVGLGFTSLAFFLVISRQDFAYYADLAAARSSRQLRTEPTPHDPPSPAVVPLLDHDL